MKLPFLHLIFLKIKISFLIPLLPSEPVALFCFFLSPTEALCGTFLFLLRKETESKEGERESGTPLFFSSNFYFGPPFRRPLVPKRSYHSHLPVDSTYDQNFSVILAVIAPIRLDGFWSHALIGIVSVIGTSNVATVSVHRSRSTPCLSGSASFSRRSQGIGIFGFRFDCSSRLSAVRSILLISFFISTRGRLTADHPKVGG